MGQLLEFLGRMIVFVQPKLPLDQDLSECLAAAPLEAIHHVGTQRASRRSTDRRDRVPGSSGSRSPPPPRRRPVPAHSLDAGRAPCAGVVRGLPSSPAGRAAPSNRSDWVPVPAAGTPPRPRSPGRPLRRRWPPFLGAELGRQSRDGARPQNARQDQPASEPQARRTLPLLRGPGAVLATPETPRSCPIHPWSWHSAGSFPGVRDSSSFPRLPPCGPLLSPPEPPRQGGSGDARAAR